jgi:autotransporter-associated beta strand protein
MKPTTKLRHFLLLAGSALLAVSTAHAAVIDWDGGDVDDSNWGSGDNWVGNAVPTWATDTIRFSGNTRNAAVNNLAADSLIGPIRFINDGSAGKTNAFTLSGARITLNGNIDTFAMTTGTITDVIELDMILNGNRIVTPNLGHDLTISGVISQDVTGRQFIKQGNGTLTLSGTNNSFSGSLAIFAGTLNVAAINDTGVNSSIGTGDTILFNQSTNGVLNYTGGVTETNKKILLGGLASFENLVGKISSNGSGKLVFDNANFNVVATGVTATTARTLVLGGANTDANEIVGRIQDNTPTGGGTGKINVTKEDAGFWILSGGAGNTYTGTTSVNGGTLLTTKALALPGYNAASRVTVASGATLGVRVDAGGWTSGEIDTLLGATPAAFTAGSNLGIDITTGSFSYANNIGATQAAKGLVKSGAGTLALSFANTHTGNTLVTGGILDIGNALALQNSAYDTASVNGGLDVTDYTTPTLGGLTGSVNLSSTLITGYGSVTNLTLNPQTGITQTYSGVVSNGASNMILTKSGAGTQILSGANTYSGGTVINEGKLILGGTSGNLGSGNYAGAISIAADATLQKDSGGAQTLSGAITGDGSVVMNSGGSLTLSNSGNNFGNLTLTLGTGLLNGGRVFIGNTGALGSATVTIEELPDALTGSTLVFTGGAAGTYGNAISVENGGGIAARGTGSGEVILSNATLPGTGLVKFNNDDSSTQSLTISNNQSLSGALTVQVGAEKMLAGTVALGEATLSGEISGGGSLIITSTGNTGNNALYGSGVLNLTNSSNSYTGGTILNSGNINLGTAGKLGATTGTLQVNNTNTAASGRSVQLILATGADTTTGSLSGTIATPTSGTNTATIQTQSGRTFTVNQTTDGTFEGAITGDGGFTLGSLSNATLTLTGTNTYTGATLVSAGTLLVSGSLTSDVTVSDNATVGGGGEVQGLILGGASLFDMFEAVDNSDSLTAATISFAATGFGIDNLVSNGAAVDWDTIANGTYTLISGTLDSTNLGNLGLANAATIGVDRSAYFQNGSLQLVVIPEPRAALLGSLGFLLIFRRRRC